MTNVDFRRYEPPADVLRHRVILVTGASGGLGSALARSLAALGATVILHGRNVKKLEALYDGIMAAGHPRPSIAQIDFETAGPEQYEALCDALGNEFGRLDGLVHNAGVLGERAPIEHYDITRWLRTMHVNVNAPFILTRYCLPLIKAAEDPSIVFVSSGIVARPRAYWGAYLVSKWATEGLSRMLVEELDSNPRVRVNSVNPGAMRTEMRLQAYPAEDRGSLPEAASVLATFHYLLGPDSRDVTGRSFDAQ